MAKPKNSATPRKRALAAFLLNVPEGKPRGYPGFIEPCLASLRDRVPGGPNWIHELKLDGYRAQVHLKDGAVTVFTRRGYDWTDRFSTVAAEAATLPAKNVILDGEMTVLNENGKSDFDALQDDLGAGKTDRLYFYAFDILYLDGIDLRAVPLIRRKQLLSEFLAATPRDRILYCDHFETSGQELLDKVCEMGMEGVVSKRRESLYRSGDSDQWLKIKCVKQEWLTVLGFIASGSSAISALYLGKVENGELRYAGKAGTGFTFSVAQQLRAALDPIVTKDRPVPSLKKPKATWVRPLYEAEVQYTALTDAGLMRHVSFLKMRPREAELSKLQSQPKARPTSSNAGRSKPKPARPDLERVPEHIRKNVMQLLPDAAVPSVDEMKRYWQSCHNAALKHLGNRLLKVVRHVDGYTFFHTGPFDDIHPDVKTITIQKRGGGEGIRLWVDDLKGLNGLAEMGIVELHPWQSIVSDIETADLMIFDLDPGEGLDAAFVTETALSLRQFLKGQGFDPWVKTSGGKGFHLMVPLKSKYSHDQARAYSKLLAEKFAKSDERYITSSSPQLRKGKLFLDYLRNGRGTTAVGAYSPRARNGFPLSMPVSWQEVEHGIAPDAFVMSSFASAPA